MRQKQVLKRYAFRLLLKTDSHFHGKMSTGKLRQTTGVTSLTLKSSYKYANIHKSTSTYDHFREVVDKFAVVQDSTFNQVILKHTVGIIRANQRSNLSKSSLTCLFQRQCLHLPVNNLCIMHLLLNIFMSYYCNKNKNISLSKEI